jgi:hypothetical protein
MVDDLLGENFTDLGAGACSGGPESSPGPWSEPLQAGTPPSSLGICVDTKRGLAGAGAGLGGEYALSWVGGPAL